MDVYEQLQQTLDANAVGAPASHYYDEILRIMFTEEEATIAVEMKFSPMTVEKISAATGIEPKLLKSKLETMADKVAIMSMDKGGERRYALLPNLPGLFEFPFMKGNRTPELEKLGKLWEQYHHDAMGKAFADSLTPQIRVVAVEKALGAENHALSYDAVAHLIDGANYIALAHCACRVSVNACDKVTEVCLLMNIPARFLVQRGYARQIDKKEAMAVLDHAEEAGLVHTSNNSADQASVICNCCSCCCTILRGKTQLNQPNAFATSAFVAYAESDECTGCGTCIDDRCPMEAINLEDDVAVVVEAKCIGCGLCVSGCPSEAMIMKNRETPSHPINETARDMVMKVLDEKDKTEDFLKIMQR